MAAHRGVYISLIAHALLIVFMIIKVSFFTKPQLNLSEAIRVDMVGLPEKYNPAQKSNDLPEKIEKQPEPVVETKPEEKKPEPKVEAKPEEKKPPEPKAQAKPDSKAKPDNDAVSLNKSKQKQKEALEKLKKMSAIDKIRQQVQNEKSADAAAKVLKGRVLSKGTSPTGLDKIQSENYLVQLDTVIKRNWALPQFLIGKPLKTKVLVKIHPDGRVIDKKIVQSSGNPTYDDYCIQAIDKASPFPKVPDKFTEIFSEDGVLFGFPE
ncbi:MAG: TonB family protein [Pseudobdellovibrio sp.]|nr:TonB family protein [Pseudobdellovibrio sp.]